MSNNGWTPERRARQAELIRQWQPWTKSTGPKSAEGKQKASANAYKGGLPADIALLLTELRKNMREQSILARKMRGFGKNIELDCDS